MSSSDAHLTEFADLARTAYAASGFSPSDEQVATAARCLARLADADEEAPIPETGLPHDEVLKRCASA